MDKIVIVSGYNDIVKKPKKSKKKIEKELKKSNFENKFLISNNTNK